MLFEPLPTIDLMIDLYEKPRTLERFQEYLKALQGDTKGDLAVPLGAFNPMAKEQAIDKLKELKELGAERIIAETLSELNKTNIPGNKNIKVALNLADDLGGAWTNRYTSDYDSKFKINALYKRNFCTVIFWTSEPFTKELIKERTLEYVFRSIHWRDFPKPETLKEHLNQEIFVAKNAKRTNELTEEEFKKLDEFYKLHQLRDDYHVIFNFFYGNEASASLAFPTFGEIGKYTGFDYAKYRFTN